MCECWRRFSWNTYAGTLWKNGMYFSTSNLEGGFPVTFTEVPVVVITPNSTKFTVLDWRYKCHKNIHESNLLFHVARNI